MCVPEAAVAARRKAGEWHPLFHIIATIAFPLVYSVYLGVAGERARHRHRPGQTEEAGSLTPSELAGRMDTGADGSPPRAASRCWRRCASTRRRRTRSTR